MMWGIGSRRQRSSSSSVLAQDAPDVAPPGRIWLGGATGFLGKHLVRELCRRDQKRRENLSLCSRRGGEVAGQSVSAVDILDSAAVEKSAKGCKTAYLCAGVVSRDASDAERLHQVHVAGTKIALAALKRAGVRRVVVASTSGTIAVGKDPNQIFDETSPPPTELIAAWPYYRSKYYGEQAALAQAAADFEVVVVNPSMLLGPGDVHESSTGDVRRFLEKAVLATPAGGISFVDVRDAAQGMVRAMRRGQSGERYLLSGANMTLARFFERLSRISGISAPRLRLPRHRGLSSALFSAYDQAVRSMGGTPPLDAVSVEMAGYYWYCSCERAERELGFSPRDPGETLRDTVDDLIERQVVAPIELRARQRRDAH